MRGLKIEYDKVPFKQFRDNTLLHYKPIELQGLGVSIFVFDKGCREAVHWHDNEAQMVMCLDGHIEFYVKDSESERQEVLRKGDVLAMHAGVRHGAVAHERTELLVIWNPMTRFNHDAIVV